MKKIPTLFERQFENHKVVGITDKVTPGCECILEGAGVATIKWDGSACAVIGEILYKRYDAKKGKPVPANAIKCQEEADPVTGHLPCWVPIDTNNPADKWFIKAFENTFAPHLISKGDGVIIEAPSATYEVIGPHFQGNPYHFDNDRVVIHGSDVILESSWFKSIRTFDGILDFFKNSDEGKIEGIVFWVDGKPKCKIKRSDFGLPWPIDYPYIPDKVGMGRIRLYR